MKKIVKVPLNADLLVNVKPHLGLHLANMTALEIVETLVIGFYFCRLVVSEEIIFDKTCEIQIVTQVEVSDRTYGGEFLVNSDFE